MTTKLKTVRFWRVTGGMIEERSDPIYWQRIGQEPGEPIEPDMLRYDRAFVSDSNPDIVVTLGVLTPTYGRWKSFGYTLTAIVSDPAVQRGEISREGNQERWSIGQFYDWLTDVRASGSEEQDHDDWHSYATNPDTGRLERVSLRAYLNSVHGAR